MADLGEGSEASPLVLGKPEARKVEAPRKLVPGKESLFVYR